MVCSSKDFHFRYNSVSWLASLLIVTWGLIGSVDAQPSKFEDLLGGSLAPKSAEKPVFNATLTPPDAKPGDEVVLTITAKLPPETYIYATTGDFGGRTQITTVKSVGLEPIDKEFQSDRPPETKHDPDFKQKVSKFHGNVAWSKTFRIEPTAEIEKVAIDLELEGQ